MKYYLFTFLLLCRYMAIAEDIPVGINAFPGAVTKKDYSGAHNRSLTDYLDENGNRVGIMEWSKPGVKQRLIPLKDNMRNGTCYEWYKDGKQLKELNTYSNGTRHGEWKQWGQDGILIGEGLMDRGNGEIKLFHPNKKIKLIVRYKDNLKEGPEVEYFENGIIRVFTRYKKDNLSEISLVNDEKGNLFTYVFCNEKGQIDGFSFFGKKKWVDEKIITSYLATYQNNGVTIWEDANWTEKTIFPEVLKQYQGMTVDEVIKSLPLPEDYMAYDNQR